MSFAPLKAHIKISHSSIRHYKAPNRRATQTLSPSSDGTSTINENNITRFYYFMELILLIELHDFTEHFKINGMVLFMIKWCKKKQKIYTTNSEILLSLSSAKWRLLMKTFSTLVRKCRPIKRQSVVIGPHAPRDCRKCRLDAGSVQLFWRQRV